MSARNREITVEDRNRAKAVLAVVLPCYRVHQHILDVIAGIGPEVSHIFVIDDACPEASGALVRERVHDPRVEVIVHDENLGVGGAMCTGYRRAFEAGADIVVKIDGDGQMDPTLIGSLILPILEGRADYTKGNRFFELAGLRQMPTTRLLGNSALSFLSKFSTGYWNLFDPTNGFTALHAAVGRHLPLDRLNQRFFFETDLLFRLNTLRAVALDVPMQARYGDESSNLHAAGAVLEFGVKNTANFAKRIFYNYFLRDFNVGSVELLGGLAGIGFGTTFGLAKWYQSLATTTAATSGTVMLAAVPILVGSQLLLAFLNYDIQNTPRQPIHRVLDTASKAKAKKAAD